MVNKVNFTYQDWVTLRIEYLTLKLHLYTISFEESEELKELKEV